MFLNACFGQVRHLAVSVAAGANLASKIENLPKDIGTDMGVSVSLSEHEMTLDCSSRTGWQGFPERTKGHSLDGIRLITSNTCTRSEGSSATVPGCALQA